MKKSFFFLTLFVFFSIVPSKVMAADFKDNINLEYRVNSDGIMYIKETKTIENLSSKYYIPADAEETFFVSSFKTRSENAASDLEKIKNTISLKDEFGNLLNPSITVEDDKIVLKMKYNNKLDRGQKRTFILEYQNFELAEKNGRVWNIYVPGFSESYNKVITSDSGASSEVIYEVKLLIPESFGNPNFVLPAPESTSNSKNYNVYEFSADELVNNSVWLQIGTEQYYKFKLTQKISPENQITSKIADTYYDLVIPSDQLSSNQEVYFEKFSYEPSYIKKDNEGNLIARFDVSVDISEIVIEGFIVVSITQPVSEKNSGSLSEIPYQDVYASNGETVYFSDLIKSALYWEVDEVQIQEVASDLKKEEDNVYKILLSDYLYVTEHVDYDNLKIEVGNVRQGALKTLEGGSSVCMEYSDLLITLLRAQKIPARAVFGYGFDHRSDAIDSTGHQWVEVYLPEIGWVSVDPTWGDTGRRDYIGGDLDHATWYVASENVNSPSPVVKYSIGGGSSIEAPIFQIDVVDNFDNTNLLTQDNLLEKYKYTKNQEIFEKINQLNIYGKIIFIGIPLLLILLLFIITITQIVKFIKNFTIKRNQQTKA